MHTEFGEKAGLLAEKIPYEEYMAFSKSTSDFSDQSTTQSLAKITGILENISSRLTDPATEEAREPDIYALAQNLSLLSRVTEDCLPSQLGKHKDLVWSILLELYLCRRSGRKVAVSDIAYAIKARPTTSLRYVQLLCSHGYVDRQPCTSDKRIVYLRINDKGVGLVTETIDKISNELPFAHLLSEASDQDSAMRC